MKRENLRYTISNKLMVLIGILGILIFIANIWALWWPAELFSLKSVSYAIEQIWLINIPVFLAWLLIIYMGFSQSRRLLIWVLPLCLSCGGKGIENFLKNAQNYMAISLSSQIFFILEVFLAATIIFTFFIYLIEKNRQGIFLEDFAINKTNYKLSRIQKKYLLKLQKFKDQPKLITLFKIHCKKYLLIIIYFIFTTIINALLGYWQSSLILLGMLFGMLGIIVGRTIIFFENWPIFKNLVDFNRVDGILAADENYKKNLVIKG